MEKKFICPMHPEIQQDHSGRCPKCGMDLVLSDDNVKIQQIISDDESYFPLFLIIGLIALSVMTIAFMDWRIGVVSWQKVMSNFMAGFFLIFSGFKLLDLKGFAEGYSTYDLLAKRVIAYAYFYPFIELLLGLSYLTGFSPVLTHWITLVVMGFSSIGVAQSLIKKQKIKCACLGTILKVPLSNVTLIEDLGMALMALLLIVI